MSKFVVVKSEEEVEDTGFGTAYHDGSGYDDCDPQGKGNRLCGNLSDNDSCSECVYLRTEKEGRFNEFKSLWDNLDPYETLSKEIIQKLKSLDIEEAYELLIKKEEVEEEECYCALDSCISCQVIMKEAEEKNKNLN